MMKNFTKIFIITNFLLQYSCAYYLKFKLIGLQGNNIVLVANTINGTQKYRKKNGFFTITTSISDGEEFNIIVKKQPASPEQLCSIKGGSGIMNENVAKKTIIITCKTVIKHVVIVGLDGMGGKYMTDDNMPVFNELKKQSSWTYVAQDALPTSSSTNWMSMVSGSTPDVHGVLSNSWERGDSIPPITIFGALRDATGSRFSCSSQGGTLCACQNDQSDYRGTINQTQNGLTCQKWTDQYPHVHSNTPELKPNKGLGDHNYCRNPDGEPRAWCYTTDLGTRWDFCDVPNCEITGGTGAKIGCFYDWGGFGRLIEDDVCNVKVSPGDEFETLDAVINYIKSDHPELVFVHIDHCDHAGHFSGWGSPTYMDALKLADDMIGDIINTLKVENMWSSTALLISSDHGGLNFSHGGDTTFEKAIPFIVRTPQTNGKKLTREIRVWDIAATAAELLGIEQPESWVASPAYDALPFWSYNQGHSGKKIKFKMINDYSLVFSSANTGFTYELSIWEPNFSDNYIPLGHVAIGQLQQPTWPTIVVDRNHDAISYPLGFEMVWTNKGTSDSKRITLWNPIPPPGGYTCPGSIATATYEDQQPPIQSVGCILESYLSRSSFTPFIWKDTGSGATLDGSIWRCLKKKTDTALLGHNLFYSRRHQTDKGYNECALLKKNKFARVWKKSNENNIFQ